MHVLSTPELEKGARRADARAAKTKVQVRRGGLNIKRAHTLQQAQPGAARQTWRRRSACCRPVPMASSASAAVSAKAARFDAGVFSRRRKLHAVVVAGVVVALGSTIGSALSAPA
jgi:hypothetical protein